jgi:hypothetical protein
VALPHGAGADSAALRVYTRPFRRWLARRGASHLQLGTLRLRLLKIGGWVRQHLGVVSLHLASSHPGEPLWYLLATRPGPPASWSCGAVSSRLRGALLPLLDVGIGLRGR